VWAHAHRCQAAASQSRIDWAYKSTAMCINDLCAFNVRRPTPGNDFADVLAQKIEEAGSILRDAPSVGSRREWAKRMFDGLNTALVVAKEIQAAAPSYLRLTRQLNEFFTSLDAVRQPVAYGLLPMEPEKHSTAPLQDGTTFLRVHLDRAPARSGLKLVFAAVIKPCTA
jgi:hypothetical protein